MKYVEMLDEAALMDEKTREKVKDWFRAFLKDIEPPSKILIFGTKWRPNDMWELMKVRSSASTVRKEK